MGTDVSKPSQLMSLLQAAGFRFKKQLGQNFLVDAHALQRILAAANVSAADGAFEIGPGAGVVTQRLAQQARRVLCVEKDTTLAPVLANALAGFDNVQVRMADVLELDWHELWQAFADCREVVVVANLPYYVTTPILLHMLESGVRFQRAVLMVQREVAERLQAPPASKAYGALSVAVQYRAEVDWLGRVPPGAFIPPPKVESALVRLRVRPQPAVQVEDERLFFRVVRAAFGQRRKTLRNALTGLGLDKQATQQVLAEAAIDPERRGETLSLSEFAGLAAALVAHLAYTGAKR
ncbi:MAG: 16S rRNA (adenine(1518)-N(6)/adenine(1519)-N(6))-dimethyltransferase RsmA [Alicyclobacillus sp.]|nr:16S rRNA (adenine(1518)-N(6)/adenine(1519)-N(6))-dimethyltransferase RsmA [Alicyclobacillus sp.]